MCRAVVRAKEVGVYRKFNFDMISLLVLLAVLASSNLIKCREQEPLTCPVTTHCECIKHDSLEIQCPRAEPRNLVVRITKPNHVSFSCENTSDDEFEMLPNITVEGSNSLKFNGCPLPRGKPLAVYLKNIRIERVLSLFFFSNGNCSDTQIEPQFLESMADLETFDLRGFESKIRELPVDIFQTTKKLTSVKVRVPDIHLPVGLFEPLDNLRELDLSGNNLQSIKPGLLQNLNKLVVLMLWRNALRSLDKNLFFGLASVTDLSLSANELESLDADVFYHLISLTLINLNENRFTSLPDGLFANNLKLRKFYLMDNRVLLETLPSDLLANLTELENVAINGNLRTIPESIFLGSTKIQSIHLQNNVLDVLPKDLLRHQTNLMILDLGGNAITQINDDFFAKSKSLKELYLSRNRMTKVSNNLFASLRNLVELHLDNNQITVIEPMAFHDLRSVEFIRLQNNLITFNEVAAPFQTLEQLKEIDLSNNSITTLFDDFTLSALTLLDLSHNKITRLSSRDLQSFNSMGVTLNLSYNLITGFVLSVQSGLDDQNLTVILEHNPFVCDCHIFELVKFLNRRVEKQRNSKIRVGDLKCTNPENLEGKLVYELSPWNLTCPLDREGTSICPEGCKCMKRPDNRYLLIECEAKVNFDLLPVASENYLKRGTLYNSEKSFLKTTELKIENTNLTTLPTRESRGYNEVTSLLVSGNKISDIKVMNIPPMIRTMELNDNNLSTLDQHVIEFLTNSTLEEMKLAGNPWNCKCENKNFLLFAQKSKKIISDYSQMKCAQGSSFHELNVGDLCSSVNTFIIVISCIAAFMGIVLGALFGFYYKYEKQIKMWLYSHDMCLWFVTEEELDKDKLYDAFISYSHKDCDFVSEKLVPKLELLNYELCVHERDWLPGVEISTQISNSVNDAKRTIIVMSPNFLESNWAQWEFRVAQSHAATEKRSRIIVILYGDIGDVDKLEPDIRDYLKLNTYVKWGDKWFWEKLQYAMPHCKTNEMLQKAKISNTIAIRERIEEL